MKKTKEVIYLVGPVSDAPVTAVITQFEAAERFLRYMGYEVINPVTKGGLLDAGPGPEFEETCLFLLQKADTVYLLVSWQDDSLARKMYRQAHAQGLKALREVNILRMGPGFAKGLTSKLEKLL